VRPVPDYLAGLEDGVKGLRIAVPTNHFYDVLEDEVRAAMEASIEVYRSLGAEIVRIEAAGVAEANRYANVIIATEAAAYHSKWVRERPQDYGRQTLNRLLPGFYYSGTRYIEALNLRARILQAFCDSVFAQADLMHAPAMPFPVPRIADSDMGAAPGFMRTIGSITHCTRPLNYLGLPTLSLPCGFTANGLPTGFQLVGRPFDEKTLLRAGRAFERETGCTEAAPTL